MNLDVVITVGKKINLLFLFSFPSLAAAVDLLGNVLQHNVNRGVSEEGEGCGRKMDLGHLSFPETGIRVSCCYSFESFKAEKCSAIR